jgi:hypothetical protein
LARHGSTICASMRKALSISVGSRRLRRQIEKKIVLNYAADAHELFHSFTHMFF